MKRWVIQHKKKPSVASASCNMQMVPVKERLTKKRNAYVVYPLVETQTKRKEAIQCLWIKKKVVKIDDWNYVFFWDFLLLYLILLYLFFYITLSGVQEESAFNEAAQSRAYLVSPCSPTTQHKTKVF